MMLCPKCGTENTDQAESCSHCHESLLNKLQANADKNQHKNNEQINQRETKTSDALKVTEKETDHATADEKYDGYQQTGYQWKMKAEILTLNMDITRQTTQWQLRKPRPCDAQQ